MAALEDDIPIFCPFVEAKLSRRDFPQWRTIYFEQNAKHPPPDADGEIWRDIPGYEGSYQVSNKGRIWSLSKPWLGGRSKPALKNTPLDGKGYQKVELYAGVGKKWAVHGLVLWAFVGPKKKNHVVRHKNGMPTDNRLENLEYGTQYENIEDAARHEWVDKIKITRAEARAICRSDKPNVELAKEYGLGPSHISNIKKGRSWGRLTADIREQKEAQRRAALALFTPENYKGRKSTDFNFFEHQIDLIKKGKISAAIKPRQTRGQAPLKIGKVIEFWSNLKSKHKATIPIGKAVATEIIPMVMHLDRIEGKNGDKIAKSCGYKDYAALIRKFTIEKRGIKPKFPYRCFLIKWGPIYDCE